MSGKDDLNRSQASAESETGSVDDATSQCTDWVGIEAEYDDRWQTKITDHPVRIEVNGGVVVDGAMNQSLATFGQEDGQEHQSVRDLLSQYKVSGVDPGEAKVCLMPAATDTVGIEREIDAKLQSFEATIRGQVGDYITAWANDGWLSVPAAYRNGLRKGGKAWWDGEVDFWSSVGGAASSAWGSVLAGAQRGADWYSQQPLGDRLLLSNPIGAGIYLGRELGEAIFEWVQELWDRRDDIMRVARAFVEGSVNAIQSALEALIDLPGELGELFTDLWKKSNDWVQNMIEVARETDVLQKAFKTIMSVLFMLTPNFWAEMKGMVEGFLIPEIVISVVLALIGTLCAAAGAAGIAARITGVVAKIRKAFTAAGAVGRVFTAFFRYVDDLFALIARLSTALRKGIDEAIEGATGAYNRIVRKSNPPKMLARKGYNIDPKKFDYMFGKVAKPDSALKATDPKKYEKLNHNYKRSQQLKDELGRVGIDDTPAGREKLMKVFEDAAAAPATNSKIGEYGTSLSKSVEFEGTIFDTKFFYPDGKMDGTPNLVSLIPKRKKI